MLDLLKNRRVAVIIAIIVILLSTVFGVNRSLGEKAAEVRDLFENGVYDQNQRYSRRSIASQLRVRSDASLGLLSISSSHSLLEDEVKTLRSARDQLLTASGPGAKYDADEAMGRAFSDLYDKLSTVSDDVDSATRADYYLSQMQGAARVIESSGYNEAVRAFDRSVMSVFPINFLKRISFVQDPELFA